MNDEWVPSFKHNGLDLQLTILIFFEKKNIVLLLFPYLIEIPGDVGKDLWTVFFFKLFLILPQVNGGTCVEFGCTHPIDGFFKNLPIYVLGFFSKYECLVNWFNHASISFLFWGSHLPFCVTRLHIVIECKKQFIWLIFNWNLFDKHTNN